MPVNYYELRGGPRPWAGAKKARNVNTVEVGDGLFFVKSANANSAPYLVAQEYICAELAKHIRLPLPPHFVGRDKRRNLVFCSLNVTIGGGSAPPLDQPRLAVANEPDLCTGLILFDIWMMNTDRKPDNVSYMPNRVPQKLGIIDHSHTLFFYSDWSARFKNKLAIEGTSAPHANRHILLDYLNTTTYISKWLNRIKSVPSEYIKEVVTDTVELGLPDFVARQAIDFLKDRRDGLEALIASNQNEFTGIADWELLWGT